MMRMRIRPALEIGVLMVCGWALQQSPGWAQAGKSPAAPGQSPAIQTVEEPNAQRTKEELSQLLDKYPPELRGVLALDPSFLGNPSYLAPYPALVGFLNAHPEVARNPSYYVDGSWARRGQDRGGRSSEMWQEVLNSLSVFTGFAMAIGLLVWLLRTIIDYKRWSRLSKVQTDVHTKLLDRFTANNDMLAYIQSPAGARFLESSPITLDAAPRSMGAPLSRILWSVQGGVVLTAGGIGMWVISGRVTDSSSEGFQALGVLGMALGLGFLISAIISFAISQRLGLIEPPPPPSRTELSGLK